MKVARETNFRGRHGKGDTRRLKLYHNVYKLPASSRLKQGPPPPEQGIPRLIPSQQRVEIKGGELTVVILRSSKCVLGVCDVSTSKSLLPFTIPSIIKMLRVGIEPALSHVSAAPEAAPLPSQPPGHAG